MEEEQNGIDSCLQEQYNRGEQKQLTMKINVEMIKAKSQRQVEDEDDELDIVIEDKPSQIGMNLI